MTLSFPQNMSQKSRFKKKNDIYAGKEHSPSKHGSQKSRFKERIIFILEKDTLPPLPPSLPQNIPDLSNHCLLTMSIIIVSTTILYYC